MIYEKINPLIGGEEKPSMIPFQTLLVIFFGFTGEVNDQGTGPLPANFWSSKPSEVEMTSLYHIITHISEKLTLGTERKTVAKFCALKRNEILRQYEDPVPQGTLDNIFGGRFHQRIKEICDEGIHFDIASGERDRFSACLESHIAGAQDNKAKTEGQGPDTEEPERKRVSTCGPKIQLWKYHPPEPLPSYHLMVINNFLSPPFHRWFWKEINSHPVMRMAKNTNNSSDRYISVATTLPNKNNRSYFMVGKRKQDARFYQIREETYPHDVALLNIANYVLTQYECSVQDFLASDSKLKSRQYKHLPVTVKMESFSPPNNVGFGSHTDADPTNTRTEGQSFQECALPKQDELMTLTMIFCDPEAYPPSVAEDTGRVGTTKYVYSLNPNNNNSSNEHTNIHGEFIDPSHANTEKGSERRGKPANVCIGFNSMTLQGPGSQCCHHKVVSASSSSLPADYMRVAITFRWMALASDWDNEGAKTQKKFENLTIPDLYTRLGYSPELPALHTDYWQFNKPISEVLTSMYPLTEKDYSVVEQFKNDTTSKERSAKRRKTDIKKKRSNDNDDSMVGDNSRNSEPIDDTKDKDSQQQSISDFVKKEMPPDTLQRAPNPFNRCSDIIRPPILVESQVPQTEMMQHWEVTRSLLIEKRTNVQVLRQTDQKPKEGETAGRFDLLLRDNNGLLMVPGRFYKYHLITNSAGIKTKDSSIANPLCSTSENHPKVFLLTQPYKSDYRTVIHSIRDSLQFHVDLEKVLEDKDSTSCLDPFSGKDRLCGLSTYGSGGSDAVGMNRSPDLQSLSSSDGKLVTPQPTPTIIVGNGQLFPYSSSTKSPVPPNDAGSTSGSEASKNTKKTNRLVQRTVQGKWLNSPNTLLYCTLTSK